MPEKRARAAVRSWKKPGRLIPNPTGLRARAVRLKPGRGMDWHTTADRQEILLALEGVIVVRYKSSTGSERRMRLPAGRALFLPQGIEHCVQNFDADEALYVYVTGPAR